MERIGYYIAFYIMQLKAMQCKILHYAQSSTYAMVGLDKLMKEDALANRQKTQIDYLDSTVFSPEQTDIQKEYDITNSIEL